MILLMFFTDMAIVFRYIDQLSRSLNVEYKQFGVDVQCQVRGCMFCLHATSFLVEIDDFCHICFFFFFVFVR